MDRLVSGATGVLTARYHPLQPDDVGMVKLSHDWRLSEEVSPLFVRVSTFKSLDGHTNLLLAGQLQTPAAHLSKLSWWLQKRKNPLSKKDTFSSMKSQSV